MSWQDLSIDFFLERLAEMPDIERIQEIDLRLVRIEETRRDVLQGDQRGTEAATQSLEVLNQDDQKLRLERHNVVMRMDRKKWSKAVRALWGQEGLEQCLIWFETTGEPEVRDIALYRRGKS